MKEQTNQFYVVPTVILEKILDGNEKIIAKLNLDESLGNELPGGYIVEADAKLLLKKKTTWFWKMRTSGFLPASKVGGKNYYRREDIQKLLDTAFTGNLK